MKLRVHPKDVPAYLELVVKQCDNCRGQHHHAIDEFHCFYPNCNRRILEIRMFDET